MNYQNWRWQRYIYLILTCLCLVTAWGCTQEVEPDYASLGLAQVSGTIRLDEKPLPNAHIIFESPDKTFSSGRTDGSGKYSLMFNSEQPGVLTGEKIVRIQHGKAFGDHEDDAEPLPAGSIELPTSYNSASELTATVNAGIQTIDFDLNSGASTTSTSQ